MSVEEVHRGDELVVRAIALEEVLCVFVEPGLVPPAQDVQLLVFLALVHEDAAHDDAWIGGKIKCQVIFMSPVVFVALLEDA